MLWAVLRSPPAVRERPTLHPKCRSKSRDVNGCSVDSNAYPHRPHCLVFDGPAPSIVHTAQEAAFPASACLPAGLLIRPSVPGPELLSHPPSAYLVRRPLFRRRPRLNFPFMTLKMNACQCARLTMEPPLSSLQRQRYQPTSYVRNKTASRVHGLP